jgi:hypothetical protein
MRKQYIITRASSLSCLVLQYIDGKYKTGLWVDTFYLGDYLKNLEDNGFEQAYYEKEYIARIKNLEEELKLAKEDHKRKSEQNLFLRLSDENEIERYEELANFWEEDC